MGARSGPIYVLAWQRTISEMRREGTRVMLTGCPGGCTHEVDLAQLEREMGPDGDLWDLRPSCPRCLAEMHFMASPGDSTPYRPLISGGRPIVGLPGR